MSDTPTPDRGLTHIALVVRDLDRSRAFYETFAGRLLDLALDNKILLPNQSPKRFTRIGEAYAIDAHGDLYAVCPEPKELTGVYKYRPDGIGAYDFTDPATWLGLVTGRLSWDDALASGSVRASGERADLSELLPLD